MIHIETLKGTKYDLMQYGLTPLKFEIDSLSPRHEMEEIEGIDGYIDLGTTFEGRTMRASFLMKAIDIPDFKLYRNEVYKLFDARTYFYLIDAYEPKRRWKVKTLSRFTPEKLTPSVGVLDVEFISPSPYAESFGTTQNPFTFDAELWQVGQGVISEDLIYTHSTNAFSIYNGSDIPIDPRQIPLTITFKGVSNNLIIRNLTNGSEWAYTGSTGASDTITLEGVRSLKNGLSVFGNTNKKLITLDEGFNDFQIVGATNFTISFNFRFYNI